MQTMRDQIVARIERLGEGKAFSAKDFLDIASRTTIDVTLASLKQDGKVRRIRRGLYDMPRINPALGGELSPDIDEAARAIARRQRWKIVPDGAWAANLLGLSTQVPSKITYLTDGPNHEVPIGRRKIHFKHARPKAMAGPEGKIALVVQALRYLGKDGVGAGEIDTLRAGLTPAEKRQLVKDTRFGVDWIYEVAKRIAEKSA
jgi:predicted transcriptional regulator of viral defense system